jgi:Bacterial archaeo-eukaryotic release factor family 11
MILHTDVPTRAQLDRLLAAREPWSVSIYLPTSPSSRSEVERLELKNLAGEASRQLQQAGAPRTEVTAIADELADLVDDGEFWRYQARSLALFLTPTTSKTFRLANNLTSLVEVSDRFHLKPLLRAVTFPHSAFVLALAQNSVRLLEMAPDLEPAEVKIPDLPTDVAGTVGKSSIRDPAPVGRIQGAEGRKTRMRQYARRIDEALRPLLNGLDLPLILAAAEPIDSIYRSVNSYPHLLATSLPGNPEAASAANWLRALGACSTTSTQPSFARFRRRMRCEPPNVAHRPTSPTWHAPPPTAWSTPSSSTSTRSSPAASTKRAAPSASMTQAMRSTTA